MNAHTTAFLAALAAQMGSLSAFLGGFAATLLATLLTLGHTGRALVISSALATTAAVAFLLAVVASTMLVADLHPDAPFIVSAGAINRVQLAMFFGFVIGTYALLGSIASSGWFKSRITGIVTTTIGSVGMVVATALIVQIS